MPFEKGCRGLFTGVRGREILRTTSPVWCSQKYVQMFCPQDRPYCNHFTYVSGSECSGIGIQEVRLFIRGSAIVPTI
jgi:hypothetical protein